MGLNVFSDLSDNFKFTQEENKKEFPILIVVTEEMQSALIEKDFSDLAITYPESDVFYEINENGKFTTSPLHHIPTSPHPHFTTSPHPHFATSQFRHFACKDRVYLLWIR